MSTGPGLVARLVAWNRGSSVAARRTPARNLANALLAVAALVAAAGLVLAGRPGALLVLALALAIGHHLWFGVVGARDRRRAGPDRGPDGAGC